MVERLVKPVGQIASNQLEITLKYRLKRPGQWKAYDQVNWL